MRQDQESWEKGYRDALEGHPFGWSERVIDWPSYASGRVEGKAERLRRPKGE